MTQTASRPQRVRSAMAARKLDGLIARDPAFRRWLTGYNSVYQSGYVLVTMRECIIVTYPTELDQARLEAAGFPVLPNGTSAAATLGKLINDHALQRVGFDGDTGADLLTGLQPYAGRLAPAFGILHAIRAVKDDQEIAGFRAAAALHDRALDYIEGILRAGVTEAQLRAELDAFLLRNGAEAFCFESVILTGARAALPHARSGNQEIRPGDLVTVDFGAFVNGCDADVCRTYVIGPATGEQQELYGIIRTAQRAAISACVPGATGHDVDAAARAVISAAGYGPLFIHSVGHGLSGGPRLQQSSTDVLQPGNIVAVEPGIYRVGWGGMRVEDNVLVTDQGPELLTHFPGDALKSL